MSKALPLTEQQADLIIEAAKEAERADIVAYDRDDAVFRTGPCDVCGQEMPPHPYATRSDGSRIPECPMHGIRPGWRSEGGRTP